MTNIETGNTVTTLSIYELLEKNFYVPAYQRGYRWTKQQVEDLLEDLYVFSKKGRKDKEFYCLQPIIVIARKWERKDKNGIFQTVDGLELVDGQQRLTTLRILFSYITEKHLSKGESFKSAYGKDVFTIDYETRESTGGFLNDLSENKDKDIDTYHISNAYKYIREWFEKQVPQRAVRDGVINTLVNDETKESDPVAKVIWYEITSKPIDTFIRVNLGKISLTNAELIRALFLQERNFGEDGAAKLKQLEIAQEWDRIENELQDENFWWFLNKAENTSSSHIEFIFDMQRTMAIEKNPESKKVTGNDRYKTFRFYNNLFGNNPDYEQIKQLWGEVKLLYDTYKEWYNKSEWYHYIGFLIQCGSSVQSIKELLDKESIVTKADVTQELLDRIKEEFVDVEWEKTGNEEAEYHLNLSYKSDKKLLRKFFLLFNLEYLIKKSRHQNLIYKFPFKSFKVDKTGDNSMLWDIEHINSATNNSLDDPNDQIEWLKNALIDVQDMPMDLRKKINAFIQSEIQDGFEELYTKIVAVAGEDEISEDLKKSIGNLTLLDAGTNRGYGNALFTSKRRKIIEKDKTGTFIPICTKNVFLKYFDGSIESKWTESDIAGYRTFLENTMTKFISNKPVVNKPAGNEEV